MLPGVEQMLTADDGDLANMLEGANQAELMKMMQTLTLQRDLLEQEEHAREQALNAEKERMSLMQQLAGEQTCAEALQAQTAAAEVAASSQMQQQEIGVGVDASEDSDYDDDDGDELDIAALIAQGGTPEQMQLLEMMQQMVAQKEALEAEESTRAEALREEMAKLEYLKQLQSQQTQQLEQQRFEEIPEAEEEEEDDDDDEVDPAQALQILEALKSQLSQLQDDPRELTPDEQARELALEHELVDLRGLLQAQVERLEAEQTEVHEMSANGATQTMEQSVYQDQDSDDGDDLLEEALNDDLLPNEMRELLAGLQAQKVELVSSQTVRRDATKNAMRDEA